MQTEGTIDSVGIDKKNTVRIRYSYWVNGDQYEGDNYYKVINDNDPRVVDKVKEQIVSKSSYPVYYDPDDPSNVICFVTDEDIEFPYVAWKIILSAWGIVIVLYFVGKAVRRKKKI